MTPTRRFFPFATAALSTLAVAGCSGAPSTPGESPTDPSTAGDAGASVVETSQTRNLHPVTTSSNESALVTGNTDFAFALYHELSPGKSASNLFYSPYSVSLALAMTYAGASGATRTQMGQALSFTLPDAALNPAFDELDLAIEAPPAHASGQDGTPFALRLADSLWGDKRVTFASAFVSTLASDYGAGLRTVDFEDKPAAGEAAINDWVKNETDGDINPLLGPGAITSDTRLVLVNAVYFNAAWKSPFSKRATHPGAFTRRDGSVVTTPLMSVQQAPARVARGASYEAVELPYSGDTTSMVIVLPNSGAFDAVEASLGGAFYASVTGALSPSQVDLTLPSFKIHGATISLRSPLEALGMVDAFTGKADFTRMIPTGDVHVSDVLHQAFVDVDESGTQAAAATAVVVNTNAVAEGQAVVVDRAFFFFIRDTATNTVLFAGRENDPTAD